MGKGNRNLPSSILHLPSIKEGALFVADAHYPHHGEEFLRLLEALESGEITAPQLFLMGDIFDLLFAYGSYIRSLYPRAIELLNSLSTRIDIFYLEGNHDFSLRKIFPNINVVPRGSQPLFMRLGEKRVALSHGDRYETGIGYEIFTLLLRSPVVCLAKPWEKKVIDAQMKRLSGKRICHEFENFERKVEKILSHYPEDLDLVIEGHFHQARRIGRYLSLPALACQKSLGVLRDGEIRFLTIGELKSRRSDPDLGRSPADRSGEE